MTPGSADDRPDDELVAAARSGDRDALETLLERHHDRLAALCRRLCRDAGDAQDATQDALVAIVRGLDRFDGRSSFATWSHRIATNACLDELRRRSRRPVPADPGPSDELVDRGPHRSVDPADAALASDERRRLSAALEALPEEFREAVLLRDVADLDYREIGELLGLRPGTVRSRIARGRGRLAQLLGEDGGNQQDDVDVQDASVGPDRVITAVSAPRDPPTAPPSTSSPSTDPTGTPRSGDAPPT